jgi:hypothetical protein
MADAELRDLRIRVHNFIDSYWKSGVLKRREVYRVLDTAFGREFHVGSTTKNECLGILSGSDLVGQLLNKAIKK